VITDGTEAEVYVDSTLSGTKHAKQIAQKANKRLYFLKVLKRAALAASVNAGAVRSKPEPLNGYQLLQQLTLETATAHGDYLGCWDAEEAVCIAFGLIRKKNGKITCCIIMLRSFDLSWSTVLVSGITILPTNTLCTLKLSRNKL